MKPSLQVRLSQHLSLTPQLQQSIRLLQLSTLELQQEIEQMLEQNPFLEADEESVTPPEAAPERISAGERESANDEAESRAEGGTEAAADAPGLDSAEFGTAEREDWENGTEREDFDGIAEVPAFAGERADAEGAEPWERGGAPESLQDHLRGQLAGMRLEPEDAAALAVLIDSLNDDGYLEDSLDEIAEHLAGNDEARRHELLERLQCALKWLQSMEPLGVGARDLAECLTLQLRALPRSEAQAIAIVVCGKHLWSAANTWSCWPAATSGS